MSSTTSSPTRSTRSTTALRHDGEPAGPRGDAGRRGNVSRFHREHEKYYSEAPLHDAVALQRIARTLMALAERWSTAAPAEETLAAPFAGAPDLNDDRAIETSGVLFMEGDGAPVELTGIVERLRAM